MESEDQKQTSIGTNSTIVCECNDEISKIYNDSHINYGDVCVYGITSYENTVIKKHTLDVEPKYKKNICSTYEPIRRKTKYLEKYQISVHNNNTFVNNSVTLNGEISANKNRINNNPYYIK
ncbi:hypothetical protein PPRFG01_0076100 [Plasmodium sp.]|nr:hypothetical protein PPRFG01_0076100 [Plasmodium sp.]